MASEYFIDLPVAIASGQSLAGAVRLGGFLLVGIVMPAAWDAAALTFQAARKGDEATFNNFYDDAGSEVTVQAAASRHIRITPADFAGIELLKVRSGTSGTPVNQTADRAIKLVVRPA